MKKTFLILCLIPLLFCTVSTTAFAKADVYNDVGSDSGVLEVPGVVKMVSKWRWNDHFMYNEVFDRSGNLHLNYRWVSKGWVHWEIFEWYGEQWVKSYEYSQRISTVGGGNELIVGFFSETHTSRQIEIYKNVEKFLQIDPETGEIIATYEYTIISHLIIKWLNDELQFEVYREMVR